MSAPEQKTREFRKVESVSLPGYFVFAADMQNRSYGITMPPPDYSLVTDNIIGETKITKSLLDHLLKLNYRAQLQEFRRFDNRFEVYNSKWSGQDGHVNSGGTRYRFSHLQPVKGETKIDIEDTGDPVIINSQVKYPDSPYRDGVFSLSVQRSLRSSDPYWRATLHLARKGSGVKMLGMMIKDAIDYLNQHIQEFELPVWQVIEPKN